MSKKPEKDHEWILFAILAILFFWGAWLARAVDGSWHAPLVIWGFVCAVICVCAIAIKLIQHYWNDLE